MLPSIFNEPSRTQLVQAGDILEQGRTGRVCINADVIDTGLNDFIKRRSQVLGFNVVLIHSDT